jgi:hypothetical protein
LTQTLLKAEYGYTVESWGGSRDHGRDAYAERDLQGKSGETPLKGPIVFQAKFVSEANARGSDYKKYLLAACRSEGGAIEKRVKQGLWREPATYVLITNCPVSGSDRDEVKAILSDVTTATINTLGASDLSDMLDLHPEISRSFPQILTHRNLLDLLSRIQAKDVYERTEAALAAAQEIIPIFVPTEAYDRAWTVLRSKNFVVLSGPPEMGKTAIGWMIAMSQVANGWEVIECSIPSDFFKAYDMKSKQLFLADDAFGRTEYRVDRGALWEADLAKILQRLNSDHLLVWTSRKHILERAMKEIDIQSASAKFPKPAEVLVQAEKLSTKEKALILYRHASAANLDIKSKQILKDNLEPLVGDVHFTPERIRRFVKIELPELTKEFNAGTLKSEDITIRVEKAIEQYTDMMEKSFLKLPDDRKWVLICLLDEQGVKTPKDVDRAFASISPVHNSKSVIELLDELDEAFIRVEPLKGPYGIVFRRPLSWVHPSYRDLVINAVSADKEMRLRYIAHGGMAALSLALSQEGGVSGERSFPLLVDEESWDAFKHSCVNQIENGSEYHRSLILNLFDSALASASNPHRERLEVLVVTVCDITRRKWDEVGDEIDLDELEKFYALADRAADYVASPNLDSTWEASWDRTRKELFSENTESFQEPDDLFNWASLLKIMSNNEPRVLRRTGFPSIAEEAIKKVLIIAEADAAADVEFDDEEEYTKEAERLKQVATALETLSDTFPDEKTGLQKAVDALQLQAESMQDRANELRIPDYEPNEDSGRSSVEVFDIKELFADL